MFSKDWSVTFERRVLPASPTGPTVEGAILSTITIVQKAKNPDEAVAMAEKELPGWQVKSVGSPR